MNSFNIPRAKTESIRRTCPRTRRKRRRSGARRGAARLRETKLTYRRRSQPRTVPRGFVADCSFRVSRVDVTKRGKTKKEQKKKEIQKIKTRSARFDPRNAYTRIRACLPALTGSHTHTKLREHGYVDSRGKCRTQQAPLVSFRFAFSPSRATHERSRRPILPPPSFFLAENDVQKGKVLQYSRRIVPGCADRLARCRACWRCRILISGGS